VENLIDLWLGKIVRLSLGVICEIIDAWENFLDLYGNFLVLFEIPWKSKESWRIVKNAKKN
jgi:hypothetical protein